MRRITAVLIGVALAAAACSAGPTNQRRDAAPSLAPRTTLARVDSSYQVTGTQVTLVRDGNESTHSTALFRLTFDNNGIVAAYCIDLATEARLGARMVADSWANHPTKNGSFAGASARINWILHNSFPAIPVDTLERAAGISDLSKEEAVTATQSAIWYFSDGYSLRGKTDDVTTLYHYLTGPANKGLPTEPSPALDIDGADARSQPNGDFGPFLVRTTAESVAVSLVVPGGKIIRDEQPVATASDGDLLYVRDSRSSIRASAKSTVQIGQLFRGVDSEPTQTLIAAKPATVDTTVIVDLPAPLL